MKLCLKAKYVSEDPSERLAYCLELGFGATQESCKSIPAAVARGWPTAAELHTHCRPFTDAGVQVAALAPVKEPLQEWVAPTPAGRERFEVFARHLDAAGEVGIACVTLHPPLDNPQSATEAADQFERNCEFYARAAERAGAAGTRLATHSPYAAPRRPDGRHTLAKPLWGGRDFLALFERVPYPANGLIYCIGCMLMAESGADARRIVFDEMAALVDRICFVHVRDVIVHLDGAFDEVMPGAGEVPAAESVRALWALGYGGPITPEHTPLVCGEAYAGPVATAYAAGWCNAILADLRAETHGAPAHGVSDRYKEGTSQ